MNKKLQIMSVILLAFIFTIGMFMIMPKVNAEDVPVMDVEPTGNISSADTQYEICPTVCVPTWIVENNTCRFLECGSGCGVDDVRSFQTEEQCKARLRQNIEHPNVPIINPTPFTETSLNVKFTPVLNKIQNNLDNSVINEGYIYNHSKIHLRITSTTPLNLDEYKLSLKMSENTGSVDAKNLYLSYKSLNPSLTDTEDKIEEDRYIGSEEPEVYNQILSFYRFSKWECYDGTYQTNLDDTSCKSAEVWKRYAKDFCEDKCDEITGACGVRGFGVDNQCKPNAVMTETYDLPANISQEDRVSSENIKNIRERVSNTSVSSQNTASQKDTRGSPTINPPQIRKVYVYNYIVSFEDNRKEIESVFGRNYMEEGYVIEINLVSIPKLSNTSGDPIENLVESEKYYVKYRPKQSIEQVKQIVQEEVRVSRGDISEEVLKAISKARGASVQVNSLDDYEVYSDERMEEMYVSNQEKVRKIKSVNDVLVSNRIKAESIVGDVDLISVDNNPEYVFKLRERRLILGFIPFGHREKYVSLNASEEIEIAE